MYVASFRFAFDENLSRTESYVDRMMIIFNFRPILLLAKAPLERPIILPFLALNFV